MVGACDPMGGPVVTDKYGYFELTTTTLLDTLRIHSPSGYYGVCNGHKPMSGGGTSITASTSVSDGSFATPLNAPLPVFKQQFQKADSCQ